MSTTNILTYFIASFIFLSVVVSELSNKEVMKIESSKRVRSACLNSTSSVTSISSNIPFLSGNFSINVKFETLNVLMC
nr:MAG TPA: hypothetical protein [Caudoviricetes sp.]